MLDIVSREAPCARSPMVEAVDMAVGSPPSAPLSLRVAQGEIVGLLFPLARPRTPVLRALAGLEAPFAGEVRFPCRARVRVAATARELSNALSAQPDLVLLDVANATADHDTWARLASERALGTSFVVATSSLDQACRGDRVSLASWSVYELARTLTELLDQMAVQTRDFLAVHAQGHARRSGALAADLRRLKIGSHALLREMRRHARAGAETATWHAAVWRFAHISLDDRVLDDAIADAQDQ
jgi:hypothetical protein